VNDRPDPRFVEDLIARGVISLTRSVREATDTARHAISLAAEWLCQRAKELRHG
jgi:hypothetical protein